MKRMLALALACTMALSLLTSCGKKEAPVEPEAPSSSSGQVPPDLSVPEEKPDASLPEEKPEVVEPADPEVVEPDQSRLKLNREDFSLFSTGATFQLKLAGVEKDTEIQWTSDNEAVATVDEKGVVTYVAPGSAKITAQANGESLFAMVRCKAEEAAETVKPEEKPQEKLPAKSINLNDFYAELDNLMVQKLGEDGAPSMMPMDSAMLDSFYPGLTALNPKQVVVVAPLISAVVAEFALAEANNAEEAAKIADIFQARIDAQVNGGGWYPATIEGWQLNSKIVTNGNYVMMVAIEDNADYIAAFNNLFK